VKCQLKILDLGLRDFESVYQLQKRLITEKTKEINSDDYLILVEHPDIYTAGRATQDLIDPTIISIERGGKVTYHNPGQLVFYPIIYFPEVARDLHLFMRRLEEVLSLTLNEFGIVGEPRPGATGVWVAGEYRKIASIGVAMKSWVSYHGAALNVCNDLSGFQRISPCGFSADVMTSMRTVLGAKCPSMTSVKNTLVRQFRDVFKYHAVSGDERSSLLGWENYGQIASAPRIG